MQGDTVKGKLRTAFSWRRLTLIFIIAVCVNYVWELVQAPLYVGFETYGREMLWHCFVASWGDGIMVLAIFAAGWIGFGRWNWFEGPGIAGYVVMLTSGFLLALLVEWVALHMLGRWQYTEKMPTLFGIGVVPVAQMLLLPPLIFGIANALGKKKR